MLYFNEYPKWIIYTGISSFLSVLGGLLVPVVFHFSNSKSGIDSRLLNYGLSLSAGSMICTSLYKMLPDASLKECNKTLIFIGFSIGITLSFILNYLVHSYTSESLIHCAHDNLHTDSDHNSRVISGSCSHIHDTNISNSLSCQEEALPLLGKPLFLKSKSSIIDLMSGNCNNNTFIPVMKSPNECLPKCNDESLVCLESNIGYDLENLAIYRDHFHTGTYSTNELEAHSDVNIATPDISPGLLVDHRHTLETPFSKLISIGIQTCIVISLHKFPEGFIMFYTNQTDESSRDLGFSIFVSLAIHNFIEGFAMTLPLFTAFQNRWYALLFTTILGGGSQPLGAFIGHELFKNREPHKNMPHMDLLLSITSGFLFVISLQMFQTAVAFSDLHHHHYESEDLVKENHSTGVICLKWCCLGVLLILCSSVIT